MQPPFDWCGVVTPILALEERVLFAIEHDTNLVSCSIFTLEIRIPISLYHFHARHILTPVATFTCVNFP